MLFQTKDQIEMGAAELVGAKFHKFSERMSIKGTGDAPENVGMKKDEVFTVHPLVGKVLIEKKYAVAV